MKTELKTVCHPAHRFYIFGERRKNPSQKTVCGLLFLPESAMREVPSHRIDIEFHRNLPANELELSQMVSNLSGIVSDETLLARLPFVTDAKEEKELVEEEKKRKHASSGGYETPVKVSEDDEE